jgi:hypothetical protein
MTIVNEDSRVVTKLGTSLTDDARVIIYDCHMFTVKATGVTDEKIAEQFLNYFVTSFPVAQPEVLVHFFTNCDVIYASSGYCVHQPFK